MASDPLEIYLLGDFRIRIGERVISNDAWKLRKAAGIVKLLALEPTHRLHREQILDTLWPELDPEAAANNFRYALHTARRLLNANGSPLREGEYLNLGGQDAVWVDVRAFEQATDAAWRGDDVAAFAAAAALYGGDLLPSDLYEEWLEARRTALRTSYLALLTRLARLHEELGEHDSAISVWRQVIAVDPTQEEAHVRVMIHHANAGRRQDALGQYGMLAETLQRELGILPDPVTVQLAEAIQSGDYGQQPPPAPAARQRTNLPVDTVTLIGREREMAEIDQMLEHGRLVTLTGPGGVGKTSLALEVARTQREHAYSGVYFVPLAALERPEQVETAFVHALGLRETSGKTPKEILVEHLRERTILLTLDNFEHIVTAAPALTGLLEECPQLKVLATSRVPLRLRGEREYPLQPLDHEAATRLFVERSQQVRPAFQPDAGQMESISAICQQLDRLPLAIELAAARSKVLPPQALLEHLEHPLKLLTGGARDLPERQRTLRNTIAWSYDLLDDEDKQAFRNLSVFAGSWTLEAAEAIGGDDGLMLDRLTTLIDNALIQQAEHPDGQPHFSMLATIREFAREQLAGSGEEITLRNRHLEYFVSFAIQVAGYLEGENQAHWLDRIEADTANLDAALNWCWQSNQPDPGLKLVQALRLYWFIRGHLAEGVRWAGLITEMPGASGHPELYADALNCAGFLARHHGDFARARAHVIRSMEISRQLGDQKRISDAQANLGYIAIQEERYDEARQLYESSLATNRQIANQQGIADTLSHLALISLYQDDFRAARRLNQESLQIWQELGDREGIAWAHHRLGIVDLKQGSYASAMENLSINLTISSELGYPWGIAWAYEGFAQLALWHDQPELAVRLVSASAVIRKVSGVHLARSEQWELDGIISAARHQMDEERFNAAWSDGERWAMEDAAHAIQLLAVVVTP